MNNRFTPENAPFGVLYMGQDLPTILFEVFGDEMFENDCRIQVAWRWMSMQISCVSSSYSMMYRMCRQGLLFA